MLDQTVHPRVRAAIARLELTRRQRQIVEGLSLGMRHDTLADSLSISKSTLRSHFRHIFTALNVENRVELMALILRDVVRDAQHTETNGVQEDDLSMVSPA